MTSPLHVFLHFHPQTKYKEASKKEMQSGSFTTLPETRDTAHSRNVNKLVSKVRLSISAQSHEPWTVSVLFALTFLSLSAQTVYKAKFEKEKGKSIYNHMIVPPDVQHAMGVAKTQSSVSHLHHCY